MRRTRSKSENLPLDQVDIREVLDDLGIDYSSAGKNVSSGWIGVTCPDPGCGDTTTHLGICLTSPVISCFSCGMTGNYITYLAKELGNFNQALEIIRKHIPKELRAIVAYDEAESFITKVEVPKGASTKITPYHKEYFIERDFPNWKELSQKHNFLFMGPVGKWKNRIIAPMFRNGRIITFTSVDISDESDLRYKHEKKELSIVHAKDYLLGLEHAKGSVCVVVEGFFDRLRVGDGCVATLGAQVTEAQKRLLIKFDRVITLFDGDEPGRKGAKRLANDLAPFTEVTRIDLDEGTDPDDLGEEDLDELRNILGKS